MYRRFFILKYIYLQARVSRNVVVDSKREVLGFLDRVSAQPHCIACLVDMVHTKKMSFGRNTDLQNCRKGLFELELHVRCVQLSRLHATYYAR
jgi:hypothetical protein